MTSTIGNLPDRYPYSRTEAMQNPLDLECPTVKEIEAAEELFKRTGDRGPCNVLWARYDVFIALSEDFAKKGVIDQIWRLLISGNPLPPAFIAWLAYQFQNAKLKLPRRGRHRPRDSAVTEAKSRFAGLWCQVRPKVKSDAAALERCATLMNRTEKTLGRWLYEDLLVAYLVENRRRK